MFVKEAKVNAKLMKMVSWSKRESNGKEVVLNEWNSKREGDCRRGEIRRK